MRYYLFSNLKRPKNKTSNYIYKVAKGADKRSEFGRRTRHLMKLPKTTLIKKLKAINYDVLLAEIKGKIIGHTAFQRHGNSLHVFSVYVSEKYRGRGYALKIIENFIQKAKSVKNINWVKIRAVKHEAIKEIIQNLKLKEKELGIKIVDEREGWIKIK
ncbi:MAG: GNAT family N-acetyltransferase [Candidatus Diapherotrites archaeon]